MRNLDDRKSKICAKLLYSHPGVADNASQRSTFHGIVIWNGEDYLCGQIGHHGVTALAAPWENVESRLLKCANHVPRAQDRKMLAHASACSEDHGTTQTCTSSGSSGTSR